MGVLVLSACRSFWTGLGPPDRPAADRLPAKMSQPRMKTVFARREQRLPDQPEVVGGVLDAVELVRALDPPAVPARLDDRLASKRPARGAVRAVALMQSASVAASG